MAEMQTSPTDVLDALPIGWSIAFEQAWASWQAGNFGIGAALIEPSPDGSTPDTVVSVGRNRVAQQEKESGLVSGNMTAHAEMNAFAALDRFNAEGLHLYTTLQPCLMCAASAMFLKVSHVFIAANDEFFDGLENLWGHHPLTAERVPATTGPFTGEHARLGQFARVLPMTFAFERLAGRAATELGRKTHPQLAVLADELAGGEAQELRKLATVDEALDALWDRLPSC